MTSLFGGKQASSNGTVVKSRDSWKKRRLFFILVPNAKYMYSISSHFFFPCNSFQIHSDNMFPNGLKYKVTFVKCIVFEFSGWEFLYEKVKKGKSSTCNTHLARVLQHMNCRQDLKKLTWKMCAQTH